MQCVETPTFLSALHALEPHETVLFEARLPLSRLPDSGISTGCLLRARDNRLNRSFLVAAERLPLVDLFVALTAVLLGILLALSH